MEPWMDPNNLRSIGGIALMTIGIVHLLKAMLGGVKYLNQIPTAAYAVLVSAGLTWFSHDVLHWLAGDRVELMTQAILQALVAFGILTAPQWKKPIGDSALASDTRDWQQGRLPSLLLVVGLGASMSVGCASSLVNADRAAHDAIAVAQDNAEYVCDNGLANQETCGRFHAHLLTVIESQMIFNRAVRENSVAEVPTLARALLSLRANIEALFTDPILRAAVLERIDQARQLLGKLKGGA